MENESVISEFRKGLWKNNPTLVSLLGICPTLAVTTNGINALTMGLSVIFVLTFSNVSVSLIRKIVPDEVRIAIFIVIIATFVTIVDIFLRANYPQLSKALGPFVPLIVVNCIILGRAVAFAARRDVLASLADGLGAGAGFTVTLVVMGCVREILSAGTIFNFKILPDFFPKFPVMVLPAGAFLTLGLFVGLHKAVEGKRS